MKRISMLMLLAAAIYALTGCMVTDYPCITDSENPNYAVCDAPECRGQNLENIQGNPNQIGRFQDDCPLHDTKGWAHIIESSLSATDQDNDGWTSEFIPFVSQDSSGNQMIMTLAQTAQVPQRDWVFHSDMYVQGIEGGEKANVDPYAYAIYTNSTYTVSRCCPGRGAQRPGDTGDITGSCEQGEEFDEFPFDYQFGTSCPQADADLASLVPHFERIGEAGRREGKGLGLSFEDRLELLRKAEVVEGGLAWTFEADEVEVTVSQGNVTKTLDLSVFDGRTFTLDPNRDGFIGNLVAKEWGIGSHEYLWVAEQFNEFKRKERIDMEVTIGQVTFSMPFALPALYDPYVAASTLDKGLRGATTATGGARQR